MAERVATYSKIIAPEEYNRIISKEHLYISASDRVIKEFIEVYKPSGRVAEVVEVGCGPARIFAMMAEIPDIHLVGIDHDEGFLAYAKEIIAKESLNAEVVRADVSTWKSSGAVDVFYSQGVHHHIGKNHDTKQYLENMTSQLADGGVYILSDEFLPEYVGEADRKVKAVVWYSHVIASARRLGHDYLAEEESKTLLDDLYEGNADHSDVKTGNQIDCILEVCTTIDESARGGDLPGAEKLANEALSKLSALRNTVEHGDATVDLSRGDYKICDSVFRKEMSDNGFEVVEVRKVGPVDTIGGMAIYVLKSTRE